MGRPRPLQTHVYSRSYGNNRPLVCGASIQQQAQQAVSASPVPQQIYEPVQQASQANQLGPACKLDRNSGALERDEYGKFVQFFRQASPYIEGHRSRTFVVVIPGVMQAAAAAADCQASVYWHVVPAIKLMVQLPADTCTQGPGTDGTTLQHHAAWTASSCGVAQLPCTALDCTALC